jgi:hypothetical protein
MPDRVIRDELLTSERYWSVSIHAQQLIIHLILAVDDAARFSGKNFTIRATCYPGRLVEASDVERWLLELHDVDLIRLYTVGSERYLYLPRFGNRRRYASSSKYPAHPNEINNLAEKKSDSGQTQVRPKSDPRQEERRGEERSGVEKKSTHASRSATKPVKPEDVTQELWDDWLALRLKKRAPVTATVIESARKEAEKAGWSMQSFLSEWCLRGSQGLKAEWLTKKMPTTSDRGAI